MSGKTPKHLRKWGPPWGGSWVPWAARGDADKLSRDGSLEGAAADAGAAAPDAAAAASAAAIAAAAALAAAGPVPTINPNGDAVKGESGGDGWAEGQGGLGGEPDDGQRAGRGAAVKEGRWLPTELARFVTHLEDSLHKDGRSERPGATSGAATRAESCVVRWTTGRRVGRFEFVCDACQARD